LVETKAFPLISFVEGGFELCHGLALTNGLELYGHDDPKVCTFCTSAPRRMPAI
jgi:hypothetical protein